MQPKIRPFILLSGKLMKYGFISWLSFFSHRQTVSGPHSPIDLHSIKGGCKALSFCCSSRTSAGRAWPLWTHWPRWTTEKGPVCRATTGTPTHIQLCSLRLFYTHSLPHPRLGNASSCQIARMICPYSLSCPVEKQTQWLTKTDLKLHTHFKTFRVHFIHFMRSNLLSCSLFHYIHCRECDSSPYEERASKIECIQTKAVWIQQKVNISKTNNHIQNK